MKVFKTGIGYDVHKLVEGRKCIIGGVNIPHSKGLAGHSDADVLVHAIADALLGALGSSDIGTWFPDNDPSLEGMDSMIILKKIKELMEKQNVVLVNIDSIVMCEYPKINPHREQMKINISKNLGVSANKIGVKATTSEKIGFVGREEGIAAQAVASVFCSDEILE